MNDDERNRILGLLTTGPATVAALAERLHLPGGVISYLLKRLEQDGLVRVGASRTVHGVPVPAYVSTAAATPLVLPAAAPLPGLTWTGTGRFPVPLWTVPHPTPGPGSGPTSIGPASPNPASPNPASPNPASPYPASPASVGPAEPPSGQTASGQAASGQAVSGLAGASAGWEERGLAAGSAVPEQRTAGALRPPYRSQDRGPRLMESKRVPMDDATFYEFAARLAALAQEFADRPSPGAPAVELAIMLHRPADETTGYGS